MKIADTYGRAVEKAPLVDRLRWWAKVLQHMRWCGKVTGTCPVAAALREAADEIELGQRTRLTYRGDVLGAG